MQDSFYYFQTGRRREKARARRRRACAHRRKNLCYKGVFFLSIAQMNAHFGGTSSGVQYGCVFGDFGFPVGDAGANRL